ncbi:unnamed protein product, partial [marine sediment metagenome]
FEPVFMFGKNIFVAIKTNKIFLFDYYNGSFTLYNFNTDKYEKNKSVLVIDNTHIVVGHSDGTITIWD